MHGISSLDSRSQVGQLAVGKMSKFIRLQIQQFNIVQYLIIFIHG